MDDKLKEYNSENAKIYDKYYLSLAKKAKYRVGLTRKVKAIDKILRDLSWDDQQIIRACSRYCNYHTASVITKIDKKKLIKGLDTATRHLYSPENISIAIPKYYKIKGKVTEFTDSDFSGNRYIRNRLVISGITCREQLLKHLEAGWYYLWTIPGIGDASRQRILMTLDKWNEEKKIE